MKIGKVERYIHETLETKGAMLFSLIDPSDYKTEEHAIKTATESVRGGADLVLIGGSIGIQGVLLDNITKGIKDQIDVPLVIFPGNISTITTNIDAIYFMSLLNSRNPYWITQAQMLSAPILRKMRIEPLPVGYIVIQPGGTVGWIGDVNMIPREKPAIAASLAVAGEFMGNRIIITDTGSNPQLQGSAHVPNAMIRAVRSVVSVPYVVAGGIKTTDDLKETYASGADIVQVGTAFEGKESAYKQALSFSKVVKEEGKKKDCEQVSTMRELSIIELSRLIDELSAVSGFYIDQFYEIEEDKFRIRVSKGGIKTNINAKLPYYIIKSDNGEVREDATNFALAIRKRISGAIINSIIMLNRDRIVKIELSKGGEKQNLIFEMFGQGNLILADKEMFISLVYKPHEFEDRALRKGEFYLPPKSDAIDLSDKEALEKEFRETEKADGEQILALHLSRRLGIGPLYIKDAIARADLEPKIKIKDVRAGALNEIKETISKIIDSSKSNKVIAYIKENIPQDFAVSELLKYSKLETKGYDSISEAIESISSEEKAPVQKKNKEEIERLKQSISKQESAIKRIEKEAAECRLAGELVSTRATAFNNAITHMKSRKDATEKELSDILGGLKVKIDRKKRAFIVEVDQK